MNLELIIESAQKYVNNSQKVRVITEKWVSDNMFCPRCGHTEIMHFENNRPVADFYCPVCKSQYELKSKNGTALNIINDGAYDTMIERIMSLDNPDFLFMSYNNTSWKVSSLFFVPKHFFTPSIIEKRKPLSPNARRAGWTGCSIKLSDIPLAGRIPIIENGIIIDKSDILRSVSVADALSISDINSRGWLLDIMCCIDLLNKTTFALSDMYLFEDILSKKHPDNHNVRAKIRQQLQILRNKGIIEFTSLGEYRRIIK